MKKVKFSKKRVVKNKIPMKGIPSFKNQRGIDRISEPRKVEENDL